MVSMSDSDSAGDQSVASCSGANPKTQQIPRPVEALKEDAVEKQEPNAVHEKLQQDDICRRTAENSQSESEKMLSLAVPTPDSDPWFSPVNFILAPMEPTPFIMAPPPPPPLWGMPLCTPMEASKERSPSGEKAAPESTAPEDAGEPAPRRKKKRRRTQEEREAREKAKQEREAEEKREATEEREAEEAIVERNEEEQEYTKEEHEKKEKKSKKEKKEKKHKKKKKHKRDKKEKKQKKKHEVDVQTVHSKRRGSRNLEKGDSHSEASATVDTLPRTMRTPEEKKKRRKEKKEKKKKKNNI